MTFFVQDIFFGIDVSKVQEVLRRQEITAVPLAPASIPGVINLRGQIIPAIDLGRRLGLAARRTIGEQVNVVVRANKGAVSLLVDEIGDVQDVTSDLSQDPPETLSQDLRGVTHKVFNLGEKLLLELDTERAVQLNPGSLKKHIDTETDTIQNSD